MAAADWGVILAGVLAMLIVSLIGRSGSVREKLSKQPMALRYGVYAALFLGVLIFGAYGIGFDASQFIYNQF